MFQIIAIDTPGNILELQASDTPFPEFPQLPKLPRGVLKPAPSSTPVVMVSTPGKPSNAPISKKPTKAPLSKKPSKAPVSKPTKAPVKILYCLNTDM